MSFLQCFDIVRWKTRRQEGQPAVRKTSSTWLQIRFCSGGIGGRNPLLCCIVRSVFYGTCAVYLTNTVEFVGVGRTRSDLRSTSSTDFTLPRLSTKFCERAFSHAAWNALQLKLKLKLKRRGKSSEAQETVEDALFMAALCNRAGDYIFALRFLLLSSSSFFSFPRLISAVADWISAICTHGLALVRI